MTSSIKFDAELDHPL